MSIKKILKLSVCLFLIVTMMWLPSSKSVNATGDDDENTEQTTENNNNQSEDSNDNSEEPNNESEPAIANGTTPSKVPQARSVDLNGVYISSGGNDSTGDGSFDNPFKTLAKAYATVTTGNTIYLLTDIIVTSTTTFGDEKDVTLSSASSTDGTPSANGTQAHTLYSDGTINTIAVSKGTLTTKNITFSSHLSNMGRILYGSSGVSVININEGTTFNDISSSGYRGTAIYTNGAVNVNGKETNPVTFKNVASSQDYGVFSLYGSTSKCVMNSTGKAGIVFDSCQTTSGGVIRMNSTSTLEINGDTANRDSVIFKNCVSSNSHGGAISAAEKTTVTMNNVTFTDCSSGNNGGAVYYAGDQMLTVKNCDFIGNSAANRGGAISASRTTIDNCSFDKNTAQNGGGVSLSISTLTNSTFTNNSANDGGGGAYYTLNGTMAASISDCTFDKNTAVKTGGGIKSAYDAANDPGTVDITDCKVTNNTCTSISGRGGGVYVSTNGNIKGCQITSNISNGNGGGVYSYQGYYNRASTVTITDSDNKATVISNNTAASGGGIFEMFISNSTNDCSLNIGGSTSVTNNTSSSNGGGIATQSSTATTIKLNITDDVKIMGNIANVGNGGGIYQNTNTTINMSGNAVISGNSCGPDKLGGGVYNANTLTKGKFTIKDNVQIVNNLTNKDSNVKNNYVILNDDALSKDNESTHYGIYVAGALGTNAAVHVNPVHSEKGVLIATALDEGVHAITDSDQEKFYNDQMSNGVVGAYPIHFDTTDITGNVNNLILYGTLYNVEHYYGIASMDDRESTDTPDIDTEHTGNANTVAKYSKKDKYGYTLKQITYQEDSSSTETPTTTDITVPVQDGLVIRLYYEKDNYNVKFKAEDEDFIKVKDGDPQSVDYKDKAQAGTTYEMVHPGKEFFTGWLYNMEVDGKTITGVVMDYTTVDILGPTTFTATYARVPFLSINAPIGGSVSIQKGNTEKYIDDGTHLDKYEFEKDDEGPYIGTGAFRADKNYHIASVTVIFPNEDGTSDSFDLDLSNTGTQGLGTGNEDGTAKLTINASKTYGTININANSSAMIIVQYEEDPAYKITYIANYSATDNTEVEVKEGLHTGDVVGSSPTGSLYLPGYRLVGWSTTRINGADSNYVNNYDENTEVEKSDITYYAVWESIGQYEYDMIVYLEDANGNFVESSTYSTIRSVAAANTWVYFNYDDNGSIKNERNIIGYTYDKANTSNLSSFYFDSSDPDLAYQHVSLKSYYRLNRFDVNYVLNNNEANIVQNGQAFNSKITPPSDPTRTGYEFMGFYEDESFVHKVNFDSYLMPNNDVTFYAKWKPNTHKLVFEYNGATGGNSLVNKDITFDSPYDSLPSPTKKGYTFNGWFAEATFVNQVDATTVASEDSDITIYASWTADTDTAYKVEHYKENIDGTYTKADTDDLTGTTDTTANATAKTYTGYTLTTTSDSKPSGNINGDGSLVLKLYYNLNTYSVKFDPNGGTGTMNNESFKYTEEKKLTKNTYTRAGYDFKGWSATKTGSVDYDDEEKVSNLTAEKDGVVTIYAVWEQRDDTAYKVEHYKENVDGTYTVADTDDLAGTTDETANATPKTYTGYTLTTTDDTVDSGTITGDGKLVLKLYYNQNKYSIKFHANSGTGTMADEEYKYNEEKKLTKNTFTKSGYTFSGWALTNDGNKKYDDEESIKALTATNKDEIDLYALWTANTDTAYKVEYYLKDAGASTYTKKDDATEDSTGTTDTDPTVTVKTFTGFTHEKTTYEKTGTTASTTKLEIAGDGTLVVKVYYTRNTHDIEYKYTGTVPTGAPNVPSKKTDVEYDTDQSVESAPTLAGYTFTGWTTNDATVNNNAYKMPDKNVEFTGSFTANTDTAYTVEYYLKDAGASTYTKKDDATEDSTGTTNTDPTVTVKTFTGFTHEKTTYEKTGTTASTTKLEIAGDGSLVVKVYYTRNTHDIEYKYTGTVPTGAPNVPSKKTDVEYDTDQSVASKPTLAGYTFTGWTTNDATVNNDAYKMPDKNVEFTGSFTANTNTPYKVEHYLQEVAGTYNVQDTDDLTGTTDTTATATAKTYPGYTLTTTSDSKPSGNISGDGKLVLKLYYKQNSYKVEFKANGGTGSMSDQSFKYAEEKALTKNDFTRAGYDFIGWATTATGTVAYNDETEVSKLTTDDNGTVKLYAVWQEKGDTPYIVEHYKENLDGSYTISDTDHKTGKTNGTGTAESKDYEGYSVDKTVTGTKDSGVIAGDGSLVLKLYYPQNTYTVKFHENDGVGTMADENFKYEELKALTTNSFTRKGYTYLGWSTSKSDKAAEYTDGQEVSKLTADKDGVIDLYAIWKKDKFEIDFNTDGGSDIGGEEIEYGDKLSKPTNPTKPGYTFGGWFTDPECTIPYDFNNPIEGPLKLYAKWDKVVVNNNGSDKKTHGGIKTGDDINVNMYYVLLLGAIAGIIKLRKKEA